MKLKTLVHLIRLRLFGSAWIEELSDEETRELYAAIQRLQ